MRCVYSYMRPAWRRGLVEYGKVLGQSAAQGRQVYTSWLEGLDDASPGTVRAKQPQDKTGNTSVSLSQPGVLIRCLTSMSMNSLYPSHI